MKEFVLPFKRDNVFQWNGNCGELYVQSANGPFLTAISEKTRPQLLCICGNTHFEVLERGGHGEADLFRCVNCNARGYV
jgi:hypothetical protein